MSFDPAGGRFVARLRVPALDGNSLLTVDRRAPRWGTGRWRVQVKDRASGSWETVLTTNDATPGRWQRRSVALTPDHISARGWVSVRVVGTGAVLDLDAISVEKAPLWWAPGPGTTWQWQLQGRIDRSHDVEMYDVDLFDTRPAMIDALHSDGRVVICYFSAGAWESWRPDAGLFPAVVKGRMNGWPGERWLDVRRLDLLGPIMEGRLDRAVAKGCDGVEPDN
ncbi:endo alpha-1,4 polygalactosaminidase, partial [bacterium]|nr:endo alpha-1,4 polygalactosaminidase [bacterium]